MEVGGSARAVRMKSRGDVGERQKQGQREGK